MSDDYFVIEPAGDLVRLVRTSRPMPEKAEDIRAAYDVITKALLQFAGLKALIDLRHGPVGRNDAVFESVASEATRRMVGHFSKVAVLVRSAVGKLQIRRLNGTRSVFQDEREALAYLNSK